MQESKTVNIEYTIHPHDGGYFAARELKGPDLTNDECLCILKYEAFAVALGAMITARAAGVPLEMAALAMREIVTRAAGEAVERAIEHIKNPGASQAPT